MRQYCVNVDGLTTIEAWEAIRLVYGPTNFDSTSVIELRDNDIADWSAWVLENGAIDFDVWLIWKLSIGTTNIGNLSSRNNNINKVGHSYAPCPHSTQSDRTRTRIMLGLLETDPLPIRVDHSIGQVVYYMETSHTGRWGFTCSFGPLCPGYANGYNYVYI